MDKEELLLDLTYKIVHAISDNKDSQSQEDKESLINILNSMNFFVENGNFDRAISEGENLLKKLNKWKLYIILKIAIIEDTCIKN